MSYRFKLALVSSYQMTNLPAQEQFEPRQAQCAMFALYSITKHSARYDKDITNVRKINVHILTASS